MSGIGRVLAPIMPHHDVQRGHNRQAVFADDGDYSYNLDTLCECSRVLAVKVKAWCLMTNHVHLLPDPGDDIKSIGLLMKRLAASARRRARSAGLVVDESVEIRDTAVANTQGKKKVSVLNQRAGDD